MFNCGPRRMNKWSNDLRKVRVDGFNRLLVSSVERGVPTPGMDQLIGRVKRKEKLRVLGGNTYSPLPISLPFVPFASSHERRMDYRCQ